MDDARVENERAIIAAEAIALLDRAAEITHPPTPAEEIAALLEARNYPSKY
jgi:hypothetical protein